MSKTARPARTRTTKSAASAKPAGRRRPATKGASTAVVGKKAGKKVVGKKSSSAKVTSKKATSAKGPAKGKGAIKRRTSAVSDNAVIAAARATRPTKAPAEKKAATPRLPADVKLAVAAAQDKQAVDLTVLDLRTASAFTDFFIVCTGNNTKQVQAIADGIESALRESGQKPALVEGYRRGEWVLLDYFSFIVHVFLPAQRTFYALERLWGGAEPIEVSATSE
jgi:ribosome-associated protein